MTMFQNNLKLGFTHAGPAGKRGCQPGTMVCQLGQRFHLVRRSCRCGHSSIRSDTEPRLKCRETASTRPSGEGVSPSPPVVGVDPDLGAFSRVEDFHHVVRRPPLEPYAETVELSPPVPKSPVGQG